MWPADALAEIFARAETGLCLLDSEGRVLRATPRFVHAVHLPPGGDDLPLWERIDAPTLEGELARSGTGLDIVVKSEPPWLGRASALGTGGFLLTERAPEDLIIRGFDDLAAAFAPFPLGIVLVEIAPAGATILAYNSAFQSILGRSLEPGMRIADLPFQLFSSDRRAPLPEDELPGPRAARFGLRTQREVHLSSGDGRWKVLSVSATPVSSPAGRSRALSCLLDLTERYEAERESRLREALYRAVVANIRDLLVLFSAVREGDSIVDWRFREVNAPLLDVLGRSREEVLGALASEILPETQLSRRSSWREVLETGDAINYELPFGPKTFLVRIFRVDADTVGIASVDISERKRAEEVLLRSRSELSTLIESVPFGVIVARDSVILYANATFVSYAGENPVGMNLSDRLRPLDGGSGRRFRLERPDRTVLTIELGAPHSIEFDGRPSVLWSAVDTTELTEAQARVVHNDRLIAVGTLAATVAHEINNPLAYVVASIEFLSERLGTHVDPDINQSLIDAKEGAVRVQHVVRDLRRLSHRDEGALVPVDLARILEGALRLAANEIRHRARLSVTIEALPPVLGDEPALGQVFLNLLVNAAQAIDKGRDAAKISVIARGDPAGWAHVEIEDTGVGISEDRLAVIFEPFYTTKPLGEGTGLGLWICRRTIARHGGEISVRSAPGVGSTVTVRLPRLAGDARALQTAAAVSPPSRRGSVAVVDDEPSIVGALRRILSQRHEVAALTSPLAVLSRIEAGERFDAVLCDLMMIELSGMELYEAVAKISPAQARRFIFVTGGAFSQDADEFLQRAEQPCLGKPFHAAEVRAVVDRVAGARWDPE